MIQKPITEIVVKQGTALQEFLDRYKTHLSKVKGLAKRTIDKYIYFASRLMEFLDFSSRLDWSLLTADKLREFVEWDAAPRKGLGRNRHSSSLFCTLSGNRRAGT
jgi:site-specific recombinase XerC